LYLQGASEKQSQFPVEGARPERRGRGCRTNKPNLARSGQGTDGRKMQNEPNLGYPGWSGADYAKQTQFASERNEGQVLCGKGVMVNCTCKRLRKNKANFRRMGGAWGTGAWMSYKQSQFSAGGQSRKTNPICARRGRREGSGIGCRIYRRHQGGAAMPKMIASGPIRGTIWSSNVHP
jgi:hypothetical protein